MKIQEIFEASPSEIVQSKTYYHGTSNEEAAKSILEKGIHPDFTATKNGILTPVGGRIYITSDLSYALIYALGGDLAGTDLKNRDFIKKEPFGYLFEISGQKILDDIQPDEDDVGEFLSLLLTQAKPTEDKFMLAINNPTLKYEVMAIAQKHLAQSTLQRVKNGEYTYFAKSGKVILKRLSNFAKLKMVEYGFHIAYEGQLIPDKCYKIDKSKAEFLKRDGSNLTDYAVRIK